MNAQAPQLPGLAHSLGERRHQLLHPSAQTQARLRLRQMSAQGGNLVPLQQGQRLVQRLSLRQARGACAAWRVWIDQAAAGGLRQLLAQLLQRHRHELAGPVALQHQTAHQAQALHIGLAVEALALGIPRGLGETVAAFPDAQRVLTQTRLARHIGDG